VPLAMMESRRGELRPFARRSLSNFIFRNEYSINLLVTMRVQGGFRRSSVHPAVLLLPAVSPQSTIGCLKAVESAITSVSPLKAIVSKGIDPSLRTRIQR
jgi:hypothetical protein